MLSILCCLDGLRLWQHPASTFLAYFSVLADAFRTSAAASGDPVLGSEGTSLILVVVVRGHGSLRGVPASAVTRFVERHARYQRELLDLQNLALVVLDVFLDLA